MNIELFLARKIFTEKENKNQLSGKIIRIALAGIALGLALMLVAVAVVSGFKKEISDKVIGFGSHIQLVNFDSNMSFETLPVNMNQPFLPNLHSLNNVSKIQHFATKPGIIKTEDYIQGIVLKGVDADFSVDFFNRHMIEGVFPDLSGPRSPDILISENLCKKLILKLGDPLFMYFINENDDIPRIRQFRISGIYRTNLQEFDDMFVVGDIRQVQHINGWDSTQVSGFEILVHDFDKLDATAHVVSESVIHYNIEEGSTLRTLTIRQKYPQIFDWLSILDMNVWVILVLMILVAGFNMISALLVLILERSRMIGTLKALGSPDSSIRKVFLYLSGFLVWRGLLWGNLLGITIMVLQKYFEVLRLDPSSYYMDIVPVHISVINIIFLNIGAMAITMLMLVVPGYFISRIKPDKTLRFD